MKKLILLSLSLSLFFVSYSQRKQVNCVGDTVKFVSLGKGQKGVGLGNPTDYSGVRFSIIDKNCITNGVAFNLFSDNTIRKTNGLDIGLSQSAGVVNGVSLGLLGNNVDYELNGFGISTVLSEGLNIYGVSLTGGFQRADKLHGVSIAGLIYRSFETKGFVASGIMLQNDSTYDGVGITGVLSRISILRGFSFGLFNWCDEVRGVQLGLINKTDYMKGVQIGAINIISENPKWARVFPLINMSFKIKPPDIDLGIQSDLFSSNDPCKNGALNYVIKTNSPTDTTKQTAVVVLPADSIILSFEKPFNPKAIQLYIDDKLVYPLKEQAMDTTTCENEVFIKIKKSDLNLIQLINTEQKKCMEGSIKPGYSIMRLSPPAKESEQAQITYTNSFLPSKKEE